MESAVKRENTEWSQFYWFSTEKVNLPRVLLIGDSIVAGHRDSVAKELENVATVAAYSTSRIVGDPTMYREIELALNDYPIDLIIFNNGLHGFGYTEEYYREKLIEFIDFLRIKTNARVVWRNSTPKRDQDNLNLFCPKINSRIIERNKIAEEVMKEREVECWDLYSPMSENVKYFCTDAIHYNEDGRAVQGAFLANLIKNYLSTRQECWQVNGFNTTFPGSVSNWHNFERHDFLLDGIKCVLVKPNCPATEQKLWYWQMRFFGAFPFPEIALLKKGWYVAHINIEELYGAPESMRRLDLLYNFLTSLGFYQKTVPVGYSRGGLDACNWSMNNPEKVICLYLDNPVCDFKSWPAGRGDSVGSSNCWNNCLASWGMNEEQALQSPINPIDNLKKLVDNSVPILLVYGDADKVVPIKENGELLSQRYTAFNGPIKTIVKEGEDHHPHSLKDPQEIIDHIYKLLEL